LQQPTSAAVAATVAATVATTIAGRSHRVFTVLKIGLEEAYEVMKVKQLRSKTDFINLLLFRQLLPKLHLRHARYGQIRVCACQQRTNPFNGV